MDLVALHDRALDATTTIVAKVSVEQLGLPTPCPDFDVRTLLNHLISGNYRFVEFAHGERGEAVPALGDYVQDDALTPYRESAAALSQVWREPGVLDRTVHLPIGDVPGVVALGIHTVETIAHGWDLARATGQPTEIDAELYAVAWQHTKDIDDSFRGPGRPFGPAVAAPAGASDTDRLMAWLGRQP
jgi:uncharacterized protein (TIGR03086 family)